MGLELSSPTAGYSAPKLDADEPAGRAGILDAPLEHGTAIMRCVEADLECKILSSSVQDRLKLAREPLTALSDTSPGSNNFLANLQNRAKIRVRRSRLSRFLGREQLAKPSGATANEFSPTELGTH